MCVVYIIRHLNFMGPIKCVQSVGEREKKYNIASQIDARIIWWPEGVVCSGVVMA